MERFDLPPIRSGPLDGLTFTVKDNIDIAGHKTSYGNPTWRNAHPAAVANAVCVDQLLAAGARCLGKVVADEFTYSLAGENPHFGTPLNAKAPDRIPGGSSSGSAASVAGGLADFSICTDSGGSIRVPASFCGIWGMRPSLHRISEAGVLPFMPSVSTVGAVAASLETLDRAIRVLLSETARPPARPQRILVLVEAFDLADAAVRRASEAALARIARRTGIVPEPIRFADIAGDDTPLAACNEAALRNLQTIEFQNTVGAWIETHRPELGVDFQMAYGNVKAFERTGALDAPQRCARLFKRINGFLAPGTVVCFPTTPTVAPLKGSLTDAETVTDFYNRTMGITAFAGVGRLPEISAPLLDADGLPAGLSFAAGHGEDGVLLAAVAAMTARG